MAFETRMLEYGIPLPDSTKTLGSEKNKRHGTILLLFSDYYWNAWGISYRKSEESPQDTFERKKAEKWIKWFEWFEW